MPGGGAVPIKESIATENASRPTQKSRGEMLPEFSTDMIINVNLTIIQGCWSATIKSHGKP